VAGPLRHLQRVDDELGAQMVRDRPADDPAGEHVEHHRRVDSALAGAVLGDVGDPQPVGASATNLRCTRSGNVAAALAA
jgi:hypothetical protein